MTEDAKCRCGHDRDQHVGYENPVMQCNVCACRDFNPSLVAGHIDLTCPNNHRFTLEAAQTAFAKYGKGRDEQDAICPECGSDDVFEPIEDSDLVFEPQSVGKLAVALNTFVNGVVLFALGVMFSLPWYFEPDEITTNVTKFFAEVVGR